MEFPSGLYPLITSVCVCVFVFIFVHPCRHVHICGYTGNSEVDIGCLPWLLSALHTEFTYLNSLPQLL